MFQNFEHVLSDKNAKIKSADTDQTENEVVTSLIQLFTSRERSCSVVECLTRDPEAAVSSLSCSP